MRFVRTNDSLVHVVLQGAGETRCHHLLGVHWFLGDGKTGEDWVATEAEPTCLVCLADLPPESVRDLLVRLCDVRYRYNNHRS